MERSQNIGWNFTNKKSDEKLTPAFATSSFPTACDPRGRKKKSIGCTMHATAVKQNSFASLNNFYKYLPRYTTSLPHFFSWLFTQKILENLKKNEWKDDPKCTEIMATWTCEKRQSKSCSGNKCWECDGEMFSLVGYKSVMIGLFSYIFLGTPSAKFQRALPEAFAEFPPAFFRVGSYRVTNNAMDS